MATAVKIILGFALIGALTLAAAGYLELQKRWSVEKELSQTTDNLQVTQRNLATTKKLLSDEKATNEQVQTNLTQSQAKVTDLNQQLSTLQSQEDQLKQAVDEQKSNVVTAQKKFDDLTTQLDGKSPADLKSDMQKAQEDLTASKSEALILKDALDAKQAEIDKWITAFHNMNNGSPMPPLAGKITFVNRTWNFVVLNVGVSHGVVPNGTLIVYHNKQFLGKLKITSADATSSIADILPDSKGDIQVGDDVLN